MPDEFPGRALINQRSELFGIADGVGRPVASWPGPRSRSILDGNQLPPDCAASVVSYTTGSMTCSARPAGQQWRSRFQCSDFPPHYINGTVVTGNGTSTATCLYDDLYGGVAFAIVA